MVVSRESQIGIKFTSQPRIVRAKIWNCDVLYPCEAYYHHKKTDLAQGKIFIFKVCNTSHTYMSHKNYLVRYLQNFINVLLNEWSLSFNKKFNDTFFYYKIVSILMQVSFVSMETTISVKIWKLLFLLVS